MKIIEMFSDHFTIWADDLPLDMFQQIPDPFPGCQIAVYFYQDGSMDSAWWKGIELKISGKDGLELDGMVRSYHDEQRKDRAEEATS